MNGSSMMKPIGIMPNHLDVREITFTNLLLLDFHPTEMESKYPVVFNRDMFALPNKKAMEVIMHFLFTRLHPQLAYEEFRDCWPVRDKVQEQQFRKVCFNWVSRIQKEDTEARLPRVVQSLFHSPGGDRFYSFLHHFSLYVLVKVMHRDHGKMVSIPTFPTKTVHNQSFTRVMSKALEAHYVVLKKRFLEFAQYAVEVEHHWKDFAVESTKEFRSLVKKKRELERQIRQLDGPTAGVKTDYQEEVEALKRTQNLQKVRDLWAGIEEFYSVQSPQRKIVDSVLQGEANKHQIDASDIQPRVPDLLLRDCEKEIRMRNIEDTFVGGKVNLLSLIQLWNLSLNKIKEQIHQGPIPSFEEVSPTVRSALHTHHAHLTNSKSLSNAIQETIPAMKEHINQMKSQCYKPLEHNRGGAPKAHVSFNLGLGLVPPTPPVSFAASDTPVAERITSFHDTLKLSPDAVSTPDVIQAWTKSVRGKQTGNQVSGSKKEFKRTEASRLPRPKQQLPDQHQPAKSTEKKKKKKPSEVAQPQKTSLTEQRKHHVTPKGKGGKDVHVPSAGLRSQKILADQIAEAVAMDHSSSPSVSSSEPSSRASTPQAQALEDPIGAFGQDAFQPRDRIARTPAKTPSGYPLSRHSQTREENRSVRRPLTDSKPGRLLETILDQSYEQNTPQSVRTQLSNTTTTSLHHTPRLQHQTVLDRSGILLTPQSVKSALFKETPSPLHSESIRHQSGIPTPSSAETELFKEASLLGDSEETYPAEFLSLLGVQTTPNLLDTSLFGVTPSPLLSHLGLEQTPASTALFQGASPKLGAFLLPQGAMDRSSMEPKPEETSPKFSLSPVDYEALSQSHVQLTPTSSKAMSFTDTPQHDRFVPHQGSVHSHSGVPQTRTTLLQQTSLQHTVGSPQRDVDTTELLERFNKVKQPAVEYLQRERDSLPRHHNTLNSSAMHPMPTPTQHYSGPLSTERVLDRSGVYPTPTTVRAGSDRATPQPYNSLSTHQETPLSGSGKVHSTKAAFTKETSMAIATSSPGYEVDTRALIERLNKIKQTQQSASGSFFYTPPTRPLESQTNGHTPRVGTVEGEVSDTSLLASRLDQIRQAQKSQQVTPGANTDGDLSTSRPSEPAQLTPLTPSSRDTHSEDDAQNGLTKFTFYSPQPSPSLPGSPFPSPNDRSLQLTPFKTDQEFSSPFQRAALSPSSEVGLAGGDLGLVEGLQWETDTPSLPERRTKTGLLTDGSSPFVTHSSPLSYSISTPLLVNSVQRQHVDGRVAEAQQFPGSLSGSTAHDGRDVSPLFILTSPQVDEGTLSNGHVTPSKHDSLLSPVIGQLIDLE